MPRCQLSFAPTLLLAFFVVSQAALAADDRPATNKDAAKPDVRRLLEQWQAAGSLPEGGVVRVSCCLGELNDQGRREGRPESLNESWEFTASQIRHVTFESQGDDEDDSRRVESFPSNSKDVCRALLDAKIYELPKRSSKGPRTLLVGTPYERGSRGIELVVDGKTVWELHETNGPALVDHPESDARIFGELHERLAKRARDEFAKQQKRRE